MHNRTCTIFQRWHSNSQKTTAFMKMKKYLILLLPAVLLLMMGCPVGLEYSLGTPGEEKLDKSLIGTWRCKSDEAEVKRVKIDKGDENSYKVTVMERGEMYSLETDKLTGWVTTIKEKNFVYFQADDDDKFYHYCYWLDGGDLVTTDVSLLDGGVDALTSTESLRKQVETSMRMDEWGKETLEWIKE
jgi:hypothetical protein